jgi:hypothetical protein
MSSQTDPSTTATFTLPSWAANLLLAGPRLPRGLLTLHALGAMVAGAGYCALLESMRHEAPVWHVALRWSLSGIVPWVLAWPLLLHLGRRLSGIRAWVAQGAVLLGVALACILLGGLIFGGLGQTEPILLLHDWIRRLPVVVVLLLLARLLPLALAERTAVGSVAVAPSFVPPSSVPGDPLSEPLVEAVRLAQSAELVRAARNYVEFERAGSVRMVRVTMAELEAALDPDRFIRIHRSVIVPRAGVVSMLRDRDGTPVLTLSMGRTVRVGRSYRQACLDRLRRT